VSLLGQGRTASVRALDGIDTVSRWVIVAALAVMAATVSAQVFFRYVLNDSIDWADEVSRLTFVWVIFLGIPHGLKYGSHVGIDLVVNLLPAGAQQAIFRLCSAGAAALMVVVAWQGILVAHETWDQPLPTINAPAALFYIAVIVSAVHCTLHLIRFTLGVSPAAESDAETTA
jgi:TRAP-type C4-dicarboxylate transport system permease small subunit